LKLITDALQSFASKSTSSLNVALLVSVGLAIRSAKAGILALISGLNIANETEEKRGFIMQQVIALILTVGAVLFAMVALAAVALLPIVIDIFPLPARIGGRLAGLGYSCFYRLTGGKRWPPVHEGVCAGEQVASNTGSPARLCRGAQAISGGADSR
jgi:hypothetical protein